MARSKDDDSVDPAKEIVIEIEEQVKKIRDSLDHFVSKVKEVSKKYADEVEICDTCDAAEPYEYVDDSAVCVSDTRIKCAVFKDAGGNPLIIDKNSRGCFEHRSRR